MEQRTVVAAFDDSNTAQTVVAELERFGLSRSQINVHSSSGSDAGTTTTSTQHEGGFTGWLKSLFGSEEETDYHRAYQSGKTVVSVEANDSQIDEVVDIIDRYNPVNVQEKSATAARSEAAGAVSSAAAGAGVSRPAASAAAAGTSLSERSGARTGEAESSSAVPVIREDLTVGKRMVQRGGVRVVARVVDKPVEETVKLRDEHVFVDRRPVDRAATSAELSRGADQVIEVEEFAEEPVIEKRARVTEEVHVGKTVSERSETVRENARNTEVNVEQLNAQNSSARANTVETDASRRNIQEGYDTGAGTAQGYATTGQGYGTTAGADPTYNPAYEYGYRSASDPRYANRQFSEVEPQLRSSYEKEYPNSTWEKMKDAVQEGWNRVTRKS